MRIPRNEGDQIWGWVSDAKYDALLYFAQLVDELLAHQSPEGLRVVSLDSYHRLREAERTWVEAERAAIPVGLDQLTAELRDFLGRDPIVTRDFAQPWEAIQPRLKSSKDRPIETVEAIRYLARKLEPAYLRRCRDYIESAVSRGKSKEKRQFRFVVENLCSYLLNTGYRAPSIYFRAHACFFSRDVNGNAVREVQNFFSYFPGSARKKYLVGFAVTEAFADVLQRRVEFARCTGPYTKALRAMRDAFTTNPQQYVFTWGTEALDVVDARARCEIQLTGIRAVAYTAMPYAEMDWDSHLIVAEEGRRGVVLREPVDALRRGRRRILRGLSADLEARLRFFIEEVRQEDDRNRLVNALTTYASAFHSESPASQLLSLWSALEGLLPTPNSSSSRISSFARDVVACHKRLQFAKHIATLHYDLFGLYRDAYSALLTRTISRRSDNVSRLASMFCLSENAAIRGEIGTLCANNPLARQRLFELYSAGQNARDLYAQVSSVAEKVEWQLQRIYRERNRIVHRANPSDVETLILTLNAYILMVFDSVLDVGSSAPPGSTIDDLFAELRITEEAREREVAAIPNSKMTAEHLEVVLGVGNR
jgi:hypothetical protein